MDKNFIKVDDLFRQRLGDGEERERSGAWLNMRELLDKEMPQQRRIGAFYWRRLFSAVAALSLIGTLGVSSYELSAAFRNRTVSDMIPEVPMSVNGEPARSLSLSNTDGTVTRNARVASRPGIRPHATGNHEGNGKTQDVTTNGVVSARARSNNNSNSNTNPGIKSVAAITAENNEENSTTANKTQAKEVNTSNQNTASKYTSHSDENGKKSTHKHANSVAFGKSEANAADENATPVALSVTESQRKSDAGNNVATGSVRTERADVAGNESKSSGIHTGSKQERTAVEKGAHEKAIAAHNNNSTRNGHAINNENRESKEATKAGNKHTNTVTGKNANAGTSKANTGHEENRVASVTSKSKEANHVADKSSTGKIALNSSVSNGASTKSSKDQHVANNSDKLHKLASENINKLAAADIATMGQSGTVQKKGATLEIPSAAASDKNADATAQGAEVRDVTNLPAASASIHDQPPTGKKVITKLVVHERTFKVADNEYELRSDTISKERIVMDLADTNEPAAAAKAAAKEDAPASAVQKKSHRRLLGRRNTANPSTPGMAGTQTAAQSKSGTHAIGSGAASGHSAHLLASTPSANGGTSESEMTPSAAATAPGATAASTSSEIIPAASAEETKSKTSESKHKGMSVIKKLAMAFNDVKNNASKTTFEPGLTAGVNSYFFGPSTLKGFQFGLTGDIIFNDSWNVMTELKYFHRVNNNTSVQDNYYSYTQVGTQYLKQLQLNSYSFSALHSLEMPVAVRYHMGNFNFYAGGNLLYAFSINTGATSIPDYNATPEYVNTPGTDDKGVLSETDFKSRFGLGYLFGFSYNLSQNFSLDLRNVQTVWDNAATTGAKNISSQLYKTPSIQLSVMYRLGGNRSKD